MAQIDPTEGTIQIRAFNLPEGAAFLVIDQETKWQTAWVAMHIERNPETEVVSIFARRADNIDDVWPNTEARTFTRSFNTTMPLLGVCMNPLDATDNDWGTD